MNNKEIQERLHAVYEQMYDPEFLTKGIYSDKKAALDKEIKQIQKACKHKTDDGISAVEEGYCTVCGRKM